MPSKKKKQAAATQRAIRMSDRMWERAEGLRDYVSGLRAMNVTTSEVIREALTRGLASLEREQATKSGPS